MISTSTNIEAARRAQAASELLRRKRAGTSLFTFGQSIEIPTVLGEARKPDETLCPAELLYAIHHRKIIGAIERTINRPYGRLLIQAPFGSAKSTYASNVTPPYVMGRRKKFKFILTSYASEMAWVQSARAMQIVDSPDYREVIWPTKYDVPLALEKKAQAHWSMNNGSELIAAGLRAGITGHRADGWVIDDPVAGQQEADSQSDRKAVYNAYTGDLLSRVKPEAWGILIMTRWHELDLAGMILPDDYKGQSGLIRCKDGLDWEVLNIQAKAEMPDDPVGRELGEYLWPEYLTPKHWQLFENAEGAQAQRVWSSMCQQRPTPQGTGQFTREMFNWYDRDELPSRLAYVGAGDYAVTKNGGDFTELGVVGLDADSNMWFVDWWYKQDTPDVWTDKTIDMAVRWKTPMWFNEGGVIDKSTRPGFMKRMRERRQFFDLRSLPSMLDKVAKLQSFQGRAAAGTVWLPKDAPWAHRLVEQLCSFPAARYDDAADVCGLLGRAIDQLPVGRGPPEERAKGLVPFTGAWLEHEEKVDTTLRYK